MATLVAAMPAARKKSLKFVEPAVFAERMVSRERLERFEVPDDDLLGLRNLQTGETLYVNGTRFRSWVWNH